MNTMCGKTRKILLSSSNIELLTPELAQAKDHLHECRKCADFFQRRAAFRGFLKDTFGMPKAPENVREEIFMAIARRQTVGPEGRRRSNRQFAKYWSTAAGLILLLSAFAYFLLVRPDGLIPARANISTELINDHIRYRLSDRAVEQAMNESEKLSQWFSGRLDFVARIPALSGFDLAGGRLCYLLDRRVALAFYQKPDQWMSLFVMQGEDLDLSAMEQIRFNGRLLCRDQAKGYQVVAWMDKDILFALVSDRDVLELAKEII